MKPVLLYGVHLWLSYKMNEPEHARRTAVGLGGLPSWDLLDMLMGMPLGEPVPLGEVTLAQRLWLPTFNVPGVFDLQEETVTRLADRPLMPEQAVILADDWNKGLSEAALFARYCKRMMIVNEPPADAEFEYAKASRYGVGVSIAVDGELIEMVAPDPLDDWVVNAADWLFAERVYTQICEGTYLPPD